MPSPTGPQLAYDANALFYIVKGLEARPHSGDSEAILQKARTWVNALNPDAYNFSGDDVTIENPNFQRDDGGGTNPAPNETAAIMYDAVNWQAIPDSARLVAGYVNGRESMWPIEAWNKFRDIAIGIDVNGTRPDAEVLDVETGDATPTMAAQWLQRRQGPGGIIYCSRSVMGAVIDACRGYDYRLWVADWNGTEHMVESPWNSGTKVIATQFANPNTSGGDFDLSLVNLDEWPRRPRQ